MASNGINTNLHKNSLFSHDVGNIYLDNLLQVLSWNEFKSICKLFEEVDWFDIAEVTGADFTSSMQVRSDYCTTV